MFFQVAMLVVVISLCLLEAVSVDAIISATFSTHLDTLLSVIADMFLVSYHGEKILHESSAISDMIYESNWYQLIFASSNKKALKDYKLCIQLSMVKAQRPFKISVGGFTSIDYQTFVNVSCLEFKPIFILLYNLF